MSNPGGDQMGAILDKKLDAEFLMSIDMDGSGEVTEYEYLAAMVSFVCLMLYLIVVFDFVVFDINFFSFFFLFFFSFLVNSSQPRG